MVIKSTAYNQDKDMLVECVRLDAAEVVQFVGKNYEPEDVFEESALREWAENNGYVLAEED
jgi:hypothetical protein